MLSYLLGSGVIMAFLYLALAAFITRAAGIEVTRFWATVGLAAGVLLGSTYAITFFVGLAIHFVRRLLTGKPIVDRET